MEPVNITDTKVWSSIDIFLFSNGQQYSPPRKYHLQSEELQWWGSTLSYLGRTHYGSGHSTIELYTLDGTKINGPLELLNGAAYVAVQPPDSFIDTGYDDYLLKATRSWEKRLAQKTYNPIHVEVSNPDIRCDMDPAVQNTADGINVLDIPENGAETVSFKARKNTISSPEKFRTPKPQQQRLQRKSITTSKQIQKKKSFDTHTTLLKKICAETDKVFPKKTSQKKNECINRKPSAVVPRKISENQDQSSFSKKRGSIKPECTADYTKNNITSGKKYTLFPFNDNLNVNTSLDEEQPIIDLYNNKESDFKSLKNDLERYPKIDETMYEPKNFTEGNIPVPDEYHIHGNIATGSNQNVKAHSTNILNQANNYDQTNIILNSDFQKNDTIKFDNDIERISQEYIPKVTNYKENKSCNDDAVLNPKSVSEKQVTDEYVAHMNKGGILLLKLKIKLKDCKTIFNSDKTKNIPMATSLSNLSKTEKTSQVDININFSGELLKPHDEQYTRDKSLQSLLNKLYAEDNDNINSKNPRIIILQCACRDYSDNRCMCDNPIRGCVVEDRKCEAQFYNQKLNKNFTSCKCHNESLRTSKVENPLENDMLSQAAKDVDEHRPSVSKAIGTRVKELAQKFEVADRTTNEKKKNSNNKYDASNDKYPRQSVVSSLVYEGAEYEIREDNSKSKRMCDKSTQTDWCNILLEARRHEDDCYSFHLPSIYLLKQCNI